MKGGWSDRRARTGKLERRRKKKGAFRSGQGLVPNAGAVTYRTQAQK